MTTKKTIKKEKQQDHIEEFVSLAADLKEIVLNLNERVAQIESTFERIRSRLRS